jgi:hypothetical protein
MPGQPPSVGGKICVDHESPAYDRRGIPRAEVTGDTVHMPRRTGTWDGPIYRRVKFGDSGSIKGTAKEAELKMRRRRFAQKREADRRALEEIYEAENARLPWIVRAIGEVLDFIFRRRSY